LAPRLPRTPNSLTNTGLRPLAGSPATIRWTSVSRRMNFAVSQ
jgi:hypothetical protein